MQLYEGTFHPLTVTLSDPEMAVYPAAGISAEMGKNALCIVAALEHRWCVLFVKRWKSGSVKSKCFLISWRNPKGILMLVLLIQITIFYVVDIFWNFMLLECFNCRHVEKYFEIVSGVGNL